ncbi:S8 family serine peptidase [Streptomyces sp. NRRL F-525]|uniref:S8 family serine peptidase n=1 Tax=Streptomyces sp. NRRL F-525 TaxID=1463861 RepID=UPI001F1F311B|nr:S8 family serine peptidase [Streptomyces sp. NRRL F-525]
MKSETGARRMRAALWAGSARGYVTTVGATLAALAVMSVGLAPAATADDVQSQQWYLDAMNAQGLWKVSTGKGISVAVVDTGVNPDTNSLKGQVLPGVDVTGTTGDETDDYVGHGTSMAELIAGTGRGGGLKGVAPGAKIIPIRTVALGIGKKGEEQGDTSASAIRAAADSDAKIINMSVGAYSEGDGEREAVQYAESKGKLLIAAVGNAADIAKNFIDYPARYPGVVGVSAINENGEVAKFSQDGAYVDLASPGVAVPTWCDKTFKAYCPQSNGTSQATAITSGAAALIWSAHPKWTANQVLRVMIDTAGRDWPKNTPSRYLGYGTIRPAQVLLKGKGDPGAADIDPVSNKKTPGLTTGTAASPSASASTSSKAPNPTSGGQTSAAASTSDSSGNTTLWVALGAAAAVVVLGGGAFAVARSRRGA